MRPGGIGTCACPCPRGASRGTGYPPTSRGADRPIPQCRRHRLVYRLPARRAREMISCRGKPPTYLHRPHPVGAHGCISTPRHQPPACGARRRILPPAGPRSPAWSERRPALARHPVRPAGCYGMAMKGSGVRFLRCAMPRPRSPVRTPDPSIPAMRCAQHDNSGPCSNPRADSRGESMPRNLPLGGRGRYPWHV